MSERSVPATAHDLARARREGDLPLSPLLTSGAVLLALRLVGPRSFESVRSSFTASWRASLSGASPLDALALARDGLASALLPALVALASVATAVILLQTGAAYRSLPRGGRRETEGFTSVAAIVALGATLATAVSSRPDLPTAAGMSAMARASLDALIASLLATGVIDLAIRRWHWRRQLQKTPAEARRALRDEEGDPFARGERQRVHRALLDVPEVGRDWHVLLDGRGALAAVVWREGMSAPVVVLHAEGALGAELSANAVNLGLAQHLRPDLVTALRGNTPGTTVPRALWDDLAALITGAGRGEPPRSG